MLGKSGWNIRLVKHLTNFSFFRIASVLRVQFSKNLNMTKVIRSTEYIEKGGLFTYPKLNSEMIKEAIILIFNFCTKISLFHTKKHDTWQTLWKILSLHTSSMYPCSHNVRGSLISFVLSLINPYITPAKLNMLAGYQLKYFHQIYSLST